MADNEQLRLLERLDKRKVALFNERQSTWDAHWKDLQKYIQPRAGRFYETETNRGDKKRESIIDSTAGKALRVLVAGMSSGLTSPARPWFRLTTPDPELMEFGPVKEWLFEVERRMRMIFQSSNVYNALPMAYEELGLFGTSVTFWMTDFNRVLRGVPITTGEYALALGDDLTVDTVYRRYRPTVKQIVEQFKGAVSQNVRQMYDRGDYDERVEITHAVEPRRQRDVSKLDARNKRWASVYWEHGQDKTLRESGFDARPFTATRWDVTGYDTYGRSPGMDALGDAKQIQLMERKKALLVSLGVQPSMVAPVSLQNGSATMAPAGITYADSVQGGSGPAFRPAYEPNPQWLGLMREDMNEVRDRINSAFFADLFLMISQMQDVRSATEVAARQEEKMLMLGPVLERAHSELLNPLIDRTFTIMLDAGLLPPPPQELFGTDLRVDYISVLAQAQKAVSTTAVERLTGFIGNLAAVDPQVIDKYDADQAVDEYADMLGVPPKIVRPDDQVAQIRQQRQQAQQMQQALASGKDAADTAKVLSQADMRGGNALSALTGNG